MKWRFLILFKTIFQVPSAIIQFIPYRWQGKEGLGRTNNNVFLFNALQKN